MQNVNVRKCSNQLLNELCITTSAGQICDCIISSGVSTHFTRFHCILFFISATLMFQKDHCTFTDHCTMNREYLMSLARSNKEYNIFRIRLGYL